MTESIGSINVVVPFARKQAKPLYALSVAGWASAKAGGIRVTPSVVPKKTYISRRADLLSHKTDAPRDQNGARC